MPARSPAVPRRAGIADARMPSAAAARCCSTHIAAARPAAAARLPESCRASTRLTPVAGFRPQASGPPSVTRARATATALVTSLRSDGAKAHSVNDRWRPACPTAAGRVAVPAARLASPIRPGQSSPKCPRSLVPELRRSAAPARLTPNKQGSRQIDPVGPRGGCNAPGARRHTTGLSAKSFAASRDGR